MSKIQVNQLKAKLDQLYKGKIDLSDVTNVNDKEKFFSTVIGISSQIKYDRIAIILESIDQEGNFSKENRFTIMVMVAVCTAIYEISLYIAGGIIYHYTFEILNFTKILAIECIYNLLITIILYPLIQNLGYKIEEVYKGDKILTRYF